MATLNEKLERIKASFAKQAPVEARAVMQRSTEDLRRAGILAAIPSVGTELAPFELTDTEGAKLSSAEVLAKGPTILTFYRGLW
ncbi:MAG: hypothetical protein ACYTG5_11880 [Planctomycetota bacterium]|jgi:hypothetical protein